MTSARVLVVDDEAIVAKSIERRLTQMGYLVPATAFSGEEAIQRAAETQPDLVLMDIRLKGEMDGVEAAELIRTDFDIPVIYLTAYADEETLQRAKITEPFGYVLKPYEVDDLIRTIEIALYKHKVDKKLRESEARYRAIVEDQTELICRSTPDGKLTFVNEAYCRYFSKNREELIGYGLMGIVPNGDREKVEKNLSVLNIDSPVTGMEYRVVMPSGEIRWHHWTARAIFNKQGRLTEYQFAGCNITERKRMEEQIRTHTEKLEQLVEERAVRIRELERQRAESEKLAATGRMAARIAHEINNPLSGIKNSLLLVKKALPENHPRYEYIGLIDKEIRRIARIVHTMFGLYRPDQESAREFSVAETIRDVVTLLEAECRQHDVRIAVEMPDVPFILLAPVGQLTQVLYNIIRNAVEASPQSGVVKIAVIENEDELTITVSDQGGGIPDELRSQIFEPFFTTKGVLDAGGLGLGLAISKSMTGAMGGTLDFESEMGHGTIFRISLPRAGALKEEKNG